jgi:hypothetical protein
MRRQRGLVRCLGTALAEDSLLVAVGIRLKRRSPALTTLRQRHLVPVRAGAVSDRGTTREYRSFADVGRAA